MDMNANQHASVPSRPRLRYRTSHLFGSEIPPLFEESASETICAAFVEVHEDGVVTADYDRFGCAQLNQVDCGTSVRIPVSALVYGFSLHEYLTGQGRECLEQIHAKLHSRATLAGRMAPLSADADAAIKKLAWELGGLDDDVNTYIETQFENRGYLSHWDEQGLPHFVLEIIALLKVGNTAEIRGHVETVILDAAQHGLETLDLALNRSVARRLVSEHRASVADYAKWVAHCETPDCMTSDDESDEDLYLSTELDLSGPTAAGIERETSWLALDASATILNNAGMSRLDAYIASLVPPPGQGLHEPVGCGPAAGDETDSALRTLAERKTLWLRAQRAAIAVCQERGVVIDEAHPLTLTID